MRTSYLKEQNNNIYRLNNINLLLQHLKQTSLWRETHSYFFLEVFFSHSSTYRKLTGGETSLRRPVLWSTQSQGTLGDKNEMQSVQPTSQDSRHYHTDESPRSIKGCCLFTKLCTYTPPCRSSSLPPSIFCPLSCFFLLNGCLHCSLSFLLYLYLTAFHRAEEPSRHTSAADIPCPWLIIVEWRPQTCLLLSPCLGYVRG